MINVTVSYDYELMWGLYRSLDKDYLENSVAVANEVAFNLYQYHEDKNFPCTWAVVGIAADTTKRADLMPIFCQEFLSCVAPKSKETFLKYCEESSLTDVSSVFNLVKSSSIQEIGSHSYFHIFMDHHPPGSEMLKFDFDCFKCFDREHDLDLKSYVIPQNIMVPGLKKLLAEYEFKAVRINPNNWLYDSDRTIQKNFLTRMLRALDFYLPINELLNAIRLPRGSMKKQTVNDQLKTSVGTLFFRGAPRFQLLAKIVLWRFKFHCWYSILTKQDVHLWTHPHNLGANSLAGLHLYSQYLDHLLKLRSRRYIEIKAMRDL